MNQETYNGGLFSNNSAIALERAPQSESPQLPAAERESLVQEGWKLTDNDLKGMWLFISGTFASGAAEQRMERLLKDELMNRFGYPAAEPDSDRTLHVLLDSRGGNLDSAYLAARYLSAYSADVRAYVPHQAKSASTLLAVAAHHIYLSPFGALGPLDTQIRDPRNPMNQVSALDCYRCVDYVRTFGHQTISEVLQNLKRLTDQRLSIDELVDKASDFTLGAVEPMMRSVSALDFGGWGRSLLIGERYMRKLLEIRSEGLDEDLDHKKIDEIARTFVYGYTHHLFPIDHREAGEIGLSVELMDGDTYAKVMKLVQLCAGRDFVGFLNKSPTNGPARPESGLARDEAPAAQGPDEDQTPPQALSDPP